MVHLKDVFLYIYVRIYKQLDAMLQNGILLTFSRLATVCLCFWFFFLDVRLSFLCLSISHPPQSCTHQKLSKPKPGGQEKQPESVCLLILLQYQTWAYYLWVSIYILLSTSCTLRFEASAFFCLSTALSGGFLILICSSVRLHLFFMCVWRVFWNSLDKEELSEGRTFLSTE